VYGVSFDKNYAEWLDDQIKDMTVSPWKRQFTKKAIARFRRLQSLVKALIKKWILMKIFR
jgi:plasmid rolling circle replication initiator protein Rep